MPPIAPEVPDDDPEVITEVKCNSVQTAGSDHLILNALGERVSSWPRMVRLIAALVVFFRTCFMKETIAVCKRSPVAADLVVAEEHLLRWIQAKHFPSDISALERSKPVPRSSRVRRLSPYLDAKGVLRVGGGYSS